jgi:hypothetical protein
VRLVSEPTEPGPAVAVASGSPAGSPRLPWVGLVLGVLALLLAILPWIGLAVALVALAVSVVAWRRSARGPVAPDASGPQGVGLSQVATGLALSVLAITAVWSVIATVVPKQEQDPLDCTSTTLDEADRFQCRELQR